MFTFAIGFISKTLFLATSTFGIPIVECVANNCLFILLSEITSLSTNINSPTPLLAKASKV